LQVNLFYHLVMKSTINLPDRDDDFCFTGTGICILSKACHRSIAVCGLSKVILKWPTGYYAENSGTVKITMDGLNQRGI